MGSIWVPLCRETTILSTPELNFSRYVEDILHTSGFLENVCGDTALACKASMTSWFIGFGVRPYHHFADVDCFRLATSHLFRTYSSCNFASYHVRSLSPLSGPFLCTTNSFLQRLARDGKEQVEDGTCVPQYGKQ